MIGYRRTGGWVLAMVLGSMVSVAELPDSARSLEATARVGTALRTELGGRGLELGAPIFVRIFKEPRELEVWIANGDAFVRFRTYPICEYSGYLGPKVREGDEQSPEGFYDVTPERMNPNSRFHLSFNLGYPNDYDRAYGRTGSALMVHGGCNSVGCYAMTDALIEEIYTLTDAALRNGQAAVPVHVFPFRMTDENLRRHHESHWLDFWKNLKQGYDAFETDRRPPRVVFDDWRYAFVPD